MPVLPNHKTGTANTPVNCIFSTHSPIKRRGNRKSALGQVGAANAGDIIHPDVVVLIPLRLVNALLMLCMEGVIDFGFHKPLILRLEPKDIADHHGPGGASQAAVMLEHVDQAVFQQLDVLFGHAVLFGKVAANAATNDHEAEVDDVQHACFL